ncbi:MAG: FHA domain-containing protein [Myxococcota bacterium]
MSYPAPVHKVLVIRGEGGETRQGIGAAPVPVGRGPRNTLILADPTVSWQHAEVWAQDGALFVRDLRSSNGTFVNGVRVEAQHALVPGDQVKFGSVAATIEDVPQAIATERRAFALEECATGVRHGLVRDRFRVGPESDADLPVDGDAAMFLVLVDEVRVVRGDDVDVPLAVGEVLTVGGRELKLVEVSSERVPTVSMAAAGGFPYRLEVALDGPLGPRAVLSHLGTDARFQVDTGNRAVLLWFLARRFAAQGDVAGEDRGWCGDGEIQAALWGRSGDSNKLDVLLHRLRSDLRKAGFDPWFVEKRNRHLRARVAEVVVLDGAE